MTVKEKAEALKNVSAAYKGTGAEVLLIEAAETIESVSAKLVAAEETIRRLLCGEYGSSCEFCEHFENEEAMCTKVRGSGSWCCENAVWNENMPWIK